MTPASPMDWPEADVQRLLNDVEHPPLAIKRTSIAKIKEMRASQKCYFRFRNGSEIPRMRLLELDVDNILARLPEEGKAFESAYILPVDLQLLRDLREMQKQFVKDKSAVRIGEACVLETKVDRLISCLMDDEPVELPLPFWAGLEGD